MKNFKGSQGGVLELIDSGISEIEKVVNQPNVQFSKTEVYMPKSIENTKEAELKDFLKETIWAEQGVKIKNWWLALDARTPNWDFVSTCNINGQRGLLLIEAKAHWNELKENDKGGSSKEENQNKIQQAISEARNEINKILSPGSISISIDKCYQLSNRIAHAWWLANQGIPVILVYLGFLNRVEMRANGKIFESNEEWQDCFKTYASKVGADLLIDKEIDCGKAKFRLISRSH